MSSHQPNPSPSDLAWLERHVIETPEQIELHFQIAGIGTRFLAIAIDTLIQAGAALLLALALVILRASPLREFANILLVITAAFIVLSFVLYFGYFVFFEIFWRGQTPGKRAMKIRVVKESGRPLTVLETIGRNLLRIVDQLPGFYGVGIVTAMLNQQSKRLGDFVAGSIVVREEPFGGSRVEWSSTFATAAPLGANLLTPEEAGLIEAFLARRNDLAPNVRYRMAGEMFKRIKPKIPALAAVNTDAERVLVSLFEEYRANARL